MKKIKLLSGIAGLTALSAGLIPTIASCGTKTSNVITLNDEVSKLEVQVYESQKHASFYFKQSNLDSATDTKVSIANLKLDGIEASSRDKLLTFRTDSAGNIQVYIDTTILRSGIVSEANEATFDLIFTNKKTNFEQTFTGFKITWQETPVVESGNIEAKNELGEDVGFYIEDDYNEGDQDIQYSFDGKTWKKMIFNSTPIIIADGVTLYIRGDNPNGFNKGSQTTSLRLETINETKHTAGDLNKKFTISGTATAILNNGGKNTEFDITKIPCDNCYYEFFEKSDAITDVDENFFTATTLKPYCYAFMFDQCSNLKHTPNLPQATLAEGCYNDMFSNCSSLQIPPKINAPTLVKRCFFQMFWKCSSLKVVKNSSGAQHENTFFTCPNEVPEDATGEMFYKTYNNPADPQADESFYYEAE